MLSNRIWLFFSLFISSSLMAQSWKSIPNLTFGIAIQYQTVIKDKWGKNHIFIGYRRGNSNKGINSPMVYFQVESKKLQIFDMKEGILFPPQYDSTLDIFVGVNNQPMLFWRLTPGIDSAKLEFLTNDSNKVRDRNCFFWKKESDGWYYGTSSPKGFFFRFNATTGKIETLGQAEIRDSSTLRKTCNYYSITPNGWAFNFRDDNSGKYFIYYQNKSGTKKYTFPLPESISPCPIAIAKSGKEVIAVRIRKKDKSIVWIIIDENGHEIVDGSVRFPEDFVTKKESKKSATEVEISKCSMLQGKGYCYYSYKGKPSFFSYDLPLDLQMMEKAFYHPKWGWVATKGYYQDIYMVDSMHKKSNFDFPNDEISVYSFTGKDNFYVSGYPSKVAQFGRDSMEFIISGNAFPKYFISSVESQQFAYFLGKNDKDRTGFQIFRYQSTTKKLDEPWKFLLDSTLKSKNAENIFAWKNKIYLFARKKQSGQLIIFELENQTIKEVPLPLEIQQLVGTFEYTFHSNAGKVAVWNNDSVFVFQLNKISLENGIRLPIIPREKNLLHRSIISFNTPNDLILSGWDKKNRKGALLWVNLKRNNYKYLVSDWELPRPFVADEKGNFMFFGGTQQQNQFFDFLSMPTKIR